MSGKMTVVVAIITSTLVTGAWELARQKGTGGTGAKEGAPTSTEPAPTALSFRALPVDSREVFRATGVFAWRWKVGLPDSPHQIAIQYSTKGGTEQTQSLLMPTKSEGGDGVAEVLVVLKYDAVSVTDSDKVSMTLEVNGVRVSKTIDNPSKGTDATGVFYAPNMTGNRINLVDSSAINQDMSCGISVLIYHKPE